jgi:hypothetical protein
MSMAIADFQKAGISVVVACSPKTDPVVMRV